jgi:single-strand DNA-binding protein
MAQVKGTINHVELLGWLGNDPELRMLPNGAAVCKFDIATKRYGRPDASGRLTTETEWISVEAWEKLGELCNRILHKGSRVLITGHLRIENWTDKTTNQPRSRVFVRCEQALFLDTRSTGAEGSAEEVAEGEEVPF